MDPALYLVVWNLWIAAAQATIAASGPRFAVRPSWPGFVSVQVPAGLASDVAARLSASGIVHRTHDAREVVAFEVRARDEAAVHAAGLAGAQARLAGARVRAELQVWGDA